MGRKDRYIANLEQAVEQADMDFNALDDKFCALEMSNKVLRTTLYTRNKEIEQLKIEKEANCTPESNPSYLLSLIEAVAQKDAVIASLEKSGKAEIREEVERIRSAISEEYAQSMAFSNEKLRKAEDILSIRSMQHETLQRNHETLQRAYEDTRGKYERLQTRSVDKIVALQAEVKNLEVAKEDLVDSAKILLTEKDSEIERSKEHITELTQYAENLRKGLNAALEKATQDFKNLRRHSMDKISVLEKHLAQARENSLETFMQREAEKLDLLPNDTFTITLQGVYN